jgi:plasmid maintenance system antidote protein VapI
MRSIFDDAGWREPLFTLVSILRESSRNSASRPPSWPGRSPVDRCNSIINGQRSVTADTALRLGHWFGTSPEFWLNLQTFYELRLVRKEVGHRVMKLARLTDQKGRTPRQRNHLQTPARAAR